MVEWWKCNVRRADFDFNFAERVGAGVLRSRFAFQKACQIRATIAFPNGIRTSRRLKSEFIFCVLLSVASFFSSSPSSHSSSSASFLSFFFSLLVFSSSSLSSSLFFWVVVVVKVRTCRLALAGLL